jgi:hypothetical protein
MLKLYWMPVDLSGLVGMGFIPLLSVVLILVRGLGGQVGLF